MAIQILNCKTASASPCWLRKYCDRLMI